MKNIFFKYRFAILICISFYSLFMFNHFVFAQTTSINKVKITKEAYRSTNTNGEFTNLLKPNTDIIKSTQEFNYKINLGLTSPHTADTLNALSFEDNISPHLNVKSVKRPTLWTAGYPNTITATIPHLIPGVEIPIPKPPSSQIQTFEVPDPMSFCDPAEYQQLKWERIELINTPSNVAIVNYDIYDLALCPLNQNAQSSCVKIASGSSALAPGSQPGTPNALLNWRIPFSGGFKIPIEHKKFRIDIRFTLKSGFAPSWTPRFMVRVLHNEVNGFANQMCVNVEVGTCPAPFIDNAVTVKTTAYPSDYGSWSDVKSPNEVINDNRMITTGSASQSRYGEGNQTEINYINQVIPADNPNKIAYWMGSKKKINDDLTFSFSKPIYSFQMTAATKDRYKNGAGESIGIEINDVRVPLHRLFIDSSNQINPATKQPVTQMKISDDGLWVDTIPFSQAINGYTLLTYTSPTLINKVKIIFKAESSDFNGILTTFRFANYINSSDVVGSTNLQLRAANEEYIYSDSAPEVIGDFSYSAMYRKTDFSGELFKLKSNNLSQKEWEVTSQFTEAKNRKIFKVNISSSMTKDEPFYGGRMSFGPFSNLFMGSWQLPLSWKNYFLPVNPNSNEDIKNMLNYLRGERELESGIGNTPQTNFRRRMLYQSPNTVALGDFVYSNPLYHDGSIFVQGNDGMLHVFDSSTGQEQFTYIPQESLKEMLNLKRLDYQHKNFMTGQQAISIINNQPILIGSTGANNSTLFALNISSEQKQNISFYNIDTFNLTNLIFFKWNMINESFPNDNINLLTNGYIGNALGQIVTYGWLNAKDYNQSPFDPQNIKNKPVYLTLNNQNKTPIALLGNGLGSKKNTAALLVVNMLSGHIATLTTDLKPNAGLGEPTVTFDSKYFPEYAYAGDSKGNLWRFKLSDANLLGSAHIEIHGKAEKIFEATKEYQGITAAPVVSNELTFNGKKGRFVYFGSGQLIDRFMPFDSKAPENKAVQAMRGLFIPNQGLSQPLKDIDLFKVHYLQENVSLSKNDQNKNPRLETSARKMNKVTSPSSKGWLIELDASKSERIIQSPWIYRNKTLVFQTTLPFSNNCSNVELDSFIMAVDLLTGSEPSVNSISEGVQGRLIKNASKGKLIGDNLYHDIATCQGGAPCKNDKNQGKAHKIALKPPFVTLRRESWVQFR